MIVEWLTSKFTQASPLARFAGYVNSSIALSHRYKRCKSAWASHLTHCHEVILSERPKDAKSVLIIGSGPLLEVPLDALMSVAQTEVTLVDMVHPIGVRKKVKKYKDRIKLIELDVNGLAHLLQYQDGIKAISQLKFKPPNAVFNKEFDYVVSANILSQLSLDPFDCLKKLKPDLATDDFFSSLSKYLGQQHIEWIKGLGHKILLITDTKRTYFDRSGQEIEQVASAYVTQSGKLIKSWDWKISPVGETSRDYSYTMQVEARTL